jgi:hypothetical protein
LCGINSGAIAYVYDWAGRRIRKSGANLVTEYIWDKDKVISEYSAGTGAQNVDYVYWGAK